MDKFCIVIPIYSENLNPIEEISLRRLWNQIGYKDYNVYLVYPKGLNIYNYENIYPTLTFMPFDRKWFKNVKMYSQLLINKNFYNKFSNYQYMYIYQLDCYLFYDKLEYWCEKRYDYIGGPIFSQNCGWKFKDKNGIIIPRVGNGGFSLRKISTFKDICVYIKHIFDQEYLDEIIIEDIFFCNDLNNDYRLFIPEWIEASKFSWDMNPDFIYDVCKYKNFPMGAHAIGKNIRFYKHFIKEFQNKEIIDYCEEKYKNHILNYYIDSYRSTMNLNMMKI